MDQHENMQLLDELTDREMDVLRLMSEGRTNRQISEQLVISFETVRWYTKQIYSKLGVHSRAQAIISARDLRLFDDAPSTDSVETSGAPNNLPQYALSFVGREAEITELSQMIRDDLLRLITLAGPGGIGKTRLCVEVARMQMTHYPDGVYFVPLYGAGDLDDIVDAVAGVLHLRLDANPYERLLKMLYNKKMLLILDNFEDVLDFGIAFVSDVLAQTQFVQLLVTSRSSLNMRDEWVRHIDGVSVPQEKSGGPDITQFSAIELFLQRAKRVRSDFSLEHNHECVVKICRQVNGMPLAIELATSWLKSLRCEDIAREIQRNIDFLTTRERDIDVRHRSILGVFDYTWDLLTDDERRILRRLSAFRGGFGFNAAEQVAGATPQILADLIDKSLLVQHSDGLYMFHDLVRQYIERRVAEISTESLSTRGGMLMAWASLLRGEFDRVFDVANVIIENQSLDHSVFEEAFGLALLGMLAGIEGDYHRCQQLCEASLNLVPSSLPEGEHITSFFTFLGLSMANCGQGYYHAAKRHILRAIRIAARLQLPGFATLCLPVLAIVLAHEVEFERAVGLLALAQTHAPGIPQWMENWPMLRQLQDDLQMQLGAAAFDAAWDGGRQLDLGQVVDDALAEE